MRQVEGCDAGAGEDIKRFATAFQLAQDQSAGLAAAAFLVAQLPTFLASLLPPSCLPSAKMSWQARVWLQKSLEMPRVAMIWEGERP